MREIKFRGKRTKGSEWLYYDLINECAEDGTPSDFQQYILDKNSICQFTGLLDKNGKDIYEGDILLCKSADEPEDKGFVCVFEDSAFRFKNIRFRDEIFYDLSFANYDYIKEKFEVVGNIYENPELLK